MNLPLAYFITEFQKEALIALRSSTWQKCHNFGCVKPGWMIENSITFDLRMRAHPNRFQRGRGFNGFLLSERAS